MFGLLPTTASPNRVAYQSLLKEYRKPCFYGGVDVPLTVEYISKLVDLYNKVYKDIHPSTPFTDLDVVLRDMVSDINFEINAASKKAGIEFRFVQTRLKAKHSIKEWETIKGSHILS